MQEMLDAMDVMDGMERIQQSMAMAWWVGWTWFVLCDLCDLLNLCCDELVICVVSLVSLGTGRVPHPSSSRVGQKAPTQPAASPGWEAEVACWSSENLLWKDSSTPNLSDKQSLGRFSQERKYRGRPSSISSKSAKDYAKTSPATPAYAPTGA